MFNKYLHKLKVNKMLAKPMFAKSCQIVLPCTITVQVHALTIRILRCYYSFLYCF